MPEGLALAAETAGNGLHDWFQTESQTLLLCVLLDMP